MRQQDLLRLTMQQTRLTRAHLAAELGVSTRALDKWLLPETSGDFRHMPETAQRLLASRFGVRKSADLSLPYDWSNPGLTDEILIQSVLRRARFADLVRVCMDYGLATVKAQLPRTLEMIPKDERTILTRILTRMLRSIEIAYSKRSPS